MSKFYCKVTSEKAMKGQGGQLFVKAEFLVMRHDVPHTIAEVLLRSADDAYILTHHNIETDKRTVLQSGTTGEKQKGERERFCEAIVEDGLCPNQITDGRKYCNAHKEYDY